MADPVGRTLAESADGRKLSEVAGELFTERPATSLELMMSDELDDRPPVPVIRPSMLAAFRGCCDAARDGLPVEAAEHRRIIGGCRRADRPHCDGVTAAPFLR